MEEARGNREIYMNGVGDGSWEQNGLVTAFGCTDELLGEEKRIFEFMRGFCQGASELPAG